METASETAEELVLPPRASGQPVCSPHVLTGYRSAHSIKAANDQLQHFVELLEGEGCIVRRPDEMDFNVSVKTPDWEVRLRLRKIRTCPQMVGMRRAAA